MNLPCLTESLHKRTTSRCPACHAAVPGEVWKVYDGKRARASFSGAFAVLRRRAVLPGQHFHLCLIVHGGFRTRILPRHATHCFGIRGCQFAALACVLLGAVSFVRRSRCLSRA